MRLATRTVMNIVGQGLSSATNIIAQLAFLAVLEPDEFGWIVIGLSAYYLALAVSRAGTSDVLISFGGSETALPSPAWTMRRLRVPAAMGTMAAFGVAALAPAPKLAIAMVAMAIPPLLAHDVIRYISWARHRSDRVIVLDLVWVVTQVATMGAFWIFAEVNATVVALGWIGGACLGLAFAFAARWATDGPTTSDLDSDASAMGSSLLIDQAPIVATAHLTPVVTALVLGAAAAGLYRTVLIPFMVAETALLAVRVSLLESLRTNGTTSDESRARLRRASVIYGGAAAALVVGSLALLLTPVGPLLGRETLRNAIVLLGLAAMLVFTRAVARPSVDYAAFRNPRRVTAMHRFRWTVIEFVGQLVGGLLIGLEGVFIARIVSTVGVSLQLVVSARSATPAVEQRADRSSHDSNIDGERLAS